MAGWVWRVRLVRKTGRGTSAIDNFQGRATSRPPGMSATQEFGGLGFGGVSPWCAGSPFHARPLSTACLANGQHTGTRELVGGRDDERMVRRISEIRGGGPDPVTTGASHILQSYMEADDRDKVLEWAAANRSAPEPMG